MPWLQCWRGERKGGDAVAKLALEKSVIIREVQLYINAPEFILFSNLPSSKNSTSHIKFHQRKVHLILYPLIKGSLLNFPLFPRFNL